ncbi:ImmA/IrrE family metallo-endopeptidase [Undibacterium sp. SXout7W]|uniref:ImmA/IrrE family metallo-endopeptidase n=1 Tax=Undibacterium sp. SXout7W TaxID=3413049 RepID=UPI003BF21CA1
MTKADIRNFELDDFPMSPVGSQPAQKYYDAFLRAKSLFDQIPAKDKSKNSEAAFLSIFKEVSSQPADQVALFRRHADAKDALTTLWLSKVRSWSKLFVGMNGLPSFNGITSDDMTGIAKLSRDIKSIRQLPHILAERGIVLIYEPYLAGMKLDGAVFALDSGNPVIALSLRYPRLDSLWFTLMHELAHISLHLDLLTTPILDDLDEDSSDLIEKEADRLALNATISRSDWRNCEAKYEFKENAVFSFAARVGVHPAIVAGRLRKELNRYNLFSEIVNAVDVRKVIWDE